MTLDAIRYEVVRLRTLRSTWWLLGISVVVTALIAVAIAHAARTQPDLVGNGRGLAYALSAGGQFSPVPIPPVLIGLVGVFATGHEYRYGTIRPTLTAIPRRGALLGAKLLVVAGWSVLVALLHLVVAYVACLVYPGQSTTSGVPWDPAGRVALGFVVLMLLWALVGAALGGLTRNIPASVTVLLVVPLVVESVVGALLTFVDALEPVRFIADYLPFSGGQAMLVVVDLGFGGLELPSPVEGGVIFATFVLVLLVLDVILFRRRDA